MCDESSDDFDYVLCYDTYFADTNQGFCGDNRVFVGKGLGRECRNSALRQCRNQDSPYLARFDCTGGAVAD